MIGIWIQQNGHRIAYAFTQRASERDLSAQIDLQQESDVTEEWLKRHKLKRIGVLIKDTDSGDHLARSPH